MNKQNIMTTKECAAYLRVSVQWLEISRLKGTGPKFCKLGRLVRYRKEALDEFLQSNERNNTIYK